MNHLLAKTGRFGVGVLIVILGLFCLVAPVGATPTLTVLHQFGAGTVTNDGSTPYANLVQGTDGNFYGTTYDGGTAGEGTASKTTPAGVVTILHSFGDGTVTNDGTHPVAALVQGTDGNFYGTTGGGGSASYGTAFMMTPAGVVTILHSFNDGSVANDGANPKAALIQGTDGNFYGTTGGGESASSGTIYEMTPTGVVTILHSFNDGSIANDGRFPSAALVQGTDGNFYGTTSQGGVNGTAFMMTPAGVITILHSFNDGSVANDGTFPFCALVQGTDGNFYGTTAAGGTAGYGTAFMMTPAGVVTILHSFNDGSIANDGSTPDAALVQGTDGNFYGTTFYGGTAGYGTAFMMTPAGTVTILHSFNDGSVANDGADPIVALVQGTDGNFYGTTYNGGSANAGTAFKMTTAGAVTVLHQFGGETVANDGATLYAGLVQGTDGNFYGTTYNGGSANSGTAFKMTPAGVVTILHSFADGTVANDGTAPEGALIQGTDGNFYGTTTGGESASSGTVFKMTPAGVVTILYRFSALAGNNTNSDGAYPYAALVQGTDGNFYGTTDSGGTAGYGTAFKMTPVGAVTILHQFGDGTVANDGTAPASALVQGTDGNFYGTTDSGRSAFGGTAFKMTPAGVVTILHQFGDGTVTNDGTYPYAGLVQGTDGNFYGTTSLGGSASNGTIYEMTPAGVVTILHSFGDGTVTNDGTYPYSGLVQGTDGNFYGTTSLGGSASNGTIYEMTPTGVVTILHQFGDGTVTDDGANSVAALIQGTDGNFYGTAYDGGAANEGTVFKMTPPSPLPVWNAQDIAAEADGTARVLWTRADGAAGIWNIDASETPIAIGTIYGPYTDAQGNWTAKALGVSSSGKARVLWTRSDGAAGLWTLNAAGRVTDIGTIYGPYTDSQGTWTAADIATEPNGNSRVLWTRSDGAAGLWTLDADDAVICIGTVSGPTSGWTAKAVSTAGNGTARILWTKTDGEASLWTMSAANTVQTVGTTYGPYSDSSGLWVAAGLGTSADGTSQVLWTRADGAAGMWTFDASDFAVSAGPVYGPTIGYTAIASDAANDQGRVLWVRSNRAMDVWGVGADDAENVTGSLYGPY